MGRYNIHGDELLYRAATFCNEGRLDMYEAAHEGLYYHHSNDDSLTNWSDSIIFNYTTYIGTDVFGIISKSYSSVGISFIVQTSPILNISTLYFCQFPADNSLCTVCGNGIVEYQEQCDGTQGCKDCSLLVRQEFVLEAFLIGGGGTLILLSIFVGTFVYVVISGRSEKEEEEEEEEDFLKRRKKKKVVRT